MGPLALIAAQVLPEIGRRFIGGRGAQAVEAATAVVSEVLGTDDPINAARLINDPEVAARLQGKLAEIALKEAEAENAELQLRLADTQDARATMVALEGMGSSVGWAPMCFSFLIILGFYGFAGYATFYGWPEESSLLLLMLGTMSAAFSSVTQFWVGSSEGSRRKDQRRWPVDTSGVK